MRINYRVLRIILPNTISAVSRSVSDPAGGASGSLRAGSDKKSTGTVQTRDIHRTPERLKKPGVLAAIEHFVQSARFSNLWTVSCEFWKLNPHLFTGSNGMQYF